MATFHIPMRLKKETPGALQYEEFNSITGEVLKGDKAIAGGIYLRKAALQGVDAPLSITVTIVANN